jgi:hypothetical protein
VPSPVNEDAALIARAEPRHPQAQVEPAEGGDQSQPRSTTESAVRSSASASIETGTASASLPHGRVFLTERARRLLGVLGQEDRFPFAMLSRSIPGAPID